MNPEHFVRESRTHAASGTASRDFGQALLRRLRTGCNRLADVLRRMHERARLRRELAQVDERLLRDIGTTRIDLEAEASKPFWRE